MDVVNPLPLPSHPFFGTQGGVEPAFMLVVKSDNLHWAGIQLSD